VKSANYEAPKYIVFPSLLPLPPSQLNNIFSNTLNLCSSLSQMGTEALSPESKIAGGWSWPLASI